MAAPSPGPTEREMVHVRLSTELIRRIDHLAVDLGLFRNEAVELILNKGLEVLKVQQSLAV